MLCSSTQHQLVTFMTSTSDKRIESEFLHKSVIKLSDTCKPYQGLRTESLRVWPDSVWSVLSVQQTGSSLLPLITRGKWLVFNYRQGQTHHQPGPVHAVMSAAVVVNANTSCIIIPGDNDVSDSELFPTSILSDLDISNAEAKFEPPLSIKNPGDDLRIRALCLEDYDRGFLQILGRNILLFILGFYSLEQAS